MSSNSVQQVIALRTGIVPCFSFSWLVYLFHLLGSSFGESRFMPAADVPSMVINSDTGMVRENRSFFLGRILRDNEPYVDESIGLKISIYKTCDFNAVKPVVRGGHYWTNMFVAAICYTLQMVVAYFDVQQSQNWASPLTLVFFYLATICIDSCRQWSVERYGFRCTPEKKTLCLTRGVSARHVMVIISGDGPGGHLDFEDIASAELPTRGYHSARHHPGVIASEGSILTTRAVQFIIPIMLLSWIFGIFLSSSYDSLVLQAAMALIGQLQVSISANAKRHHSQLDRIHLQHVETISKDNITRTLALFDLKYPLAGSFLVPLYQGSGGMASRSRQSYAPYRSPRASSGDL